MHFALQLLAICFLVPLFTQCGSNPAAVTNVVTGPFDERGDYIEDWADQPDKWFKPPAPYGWKKKTTTTVVKKENIPPKTEFSPPPEKIAVVSEVQTRHQPIEASLKPKPKPATVSKPKPDPKPVAVRHTVKKGDTLSSLARRYGSSVSKIQAANGIKGSVIRLGQNLKIPK